MFFRRGNDDEEEMFSPSDVRTGIDLNTDEEALAELEDPLLREHIEEARLGLYQFQNDQTLLKNIDELKQERLKMKTELSQTNFNLHNCNVKLAELTENLFTIINGISRFKSGYASYGYPPKTSDPKVIYEHIIGKLNSLHKDLDECADNAKKTDNSFIVTRQRCEYVADGLIAHFD